MPEELTSIEAKSPYELRVEHAKHVPESTMRAALASGDVGFLHSFTTGATVDGPGVRVVAWTAGCMWRCLYCHNPDTWSMTNGIPITIEDATEQLGKYRHGLKAMSGGLTVSGGEPLMQHRFVMILFRAAQAMGIHTALDTNGYFGDRLSDEDLDAVGLVLLDIKKWDLDRHQQLTGMDGRPTREFARRLASLRKPIWLRFVLVPGLTDDKEDVAKIADFVASLGNVQRVDVLPFHQMGRFKWKALKRDYVLDSVQAPSAESVEAVCAEFRAKGLYAP